MKPGLLSASTFKQRRIGAHPNRQVSAETTATQPPEAEPEQTAATAGRPPAAELTHVGWLPGKEIGLAEWSAVGRRLGEIGRCSQWWLGDWIHYGNARFGERYTRAVKLTGYDAQSLMNMVYVASRFDISRRRENLSWSHHAAVAALEPDSQEYWLQRATADKLSVADLRAELRGRRQALQEGELETHPVGAVAETPSPSNEAQLAVVCPTCGTTVPVPSS